MLIIMIMLNAPWVAKTADTLVVRRVPLCTGRVAL